MGKRKKKVNLWLNRPKKHRIIYTTPRKNVCIGLPRTPSTLKYGASPLKTKCPVNSSPLRAGKHLLTPQSRHKSRKKLNLELTDCNESMTEDFEECLLTDEDIPSGAKEFIDLASDYEVLKNLSSAGLLIYLIQFLTLVKENKYPLKNIALLLWLETVRWYSSLTAQSMWYFEETKRFWRAGYRLFHGKFLCFMSGPKSIGALISDNKRYGKIDPRNSEINFAVPNRNSLINNNESQNIIPPGLISKTLNVLKQSKSTNTFMLCCDGKKVTAGLDKDFGDVNMFGYESKPTASDSKDRLNDEKNRINELLELANDTSQGFQKENTLSIKIREMLYTLTVRVKETRNIKDRQEYGLKKLKERAGPEWKSSKYLYAISGIQAYLYRLRQYIDGTLNNILKLCRLGSELCNSYNNFVEANEVNPNRQGNMRVLKQFSEQVQPVPMSLIKQRSDEWHTVRDSAAVTGSTLHNAIGLRTLKEQKVHFDKFVDKKQTDNDCTNDTTRMYMEHGTKNEPNAVATLVGRFMPLFYPDLTYTEEGCYMVNNFVEVSPDGSLRSADLDTCVTGVEIKCPFPKSDQSSIYYEVPKYYVCQCLSEMKALNTDSLIFVCYTEISTTFFKMDFDECLWNIINQEAEGLYTTASPKRPTRLSPGVRTLKDAIEIYVKERIQLIVEIPSTKLKLIDQTSAAGYDMSAPPYYANYSVEKRTRDFNDILDELNMTLSETGDLLETGYQLTRKKASEVMVWVLSNKDRLWSSEIPNSVPIAYGLKDYKFSAQSLREACDFILKECKDNGLHVPLLAFDGQWYSVMVRDGEGKSLTKLQLQKDVWQEINKMKKKELVEIIQDLNRPENMTVSKVNGVKIVVSNSRAFRCFRHYYDTSFKTKTKQRQTVEETNDLSTLTWLPENVLKQIEEKGDRDLLSSLVAVSKEIEINSSHDESVLIENNDTTAEDNEADEEVQLSMEDCVEINGSMNQLRTSRKWTPDQIKIQVETAEKINNFTIQELDLLAEYVKKSHRMTYLKKWVKCDKVNALSRVLGDKSTLEKKQRTDNGDPPSLQQLCMKAVNGIKVRKASLAIGYASYVFPERLKNWQNQSPVPNTIKVNDEVFDIDWYSIPERNAATGELLCKTLDSHHLLTNLRTKTSTTGLKNISPDAWKRVAHSYETNLTPSMVDDLVDKQSNSFAQTHFSIEVENKMRNNGDVAEAEFCKLIRGWYEAEDCPALIVAERVKRWLALRNYLLEQIDFTSFPPPTQYINGLSIIAFEGFLTGIDTKMQLYHLCQGSYCVRTASSLPAETCVGGIQDMNLNNSVAVKAKDVPKIMASLTELMTYKCNPDRGFYMQTSRASVYPVVQGRNEYPEEPEVCSDTVDAILARNHPFDEADRRRLKPHRKSGTVNKDLDAAPRGAQPMRRQFFKCDESKIDPLKRSGYKIN